jgi:hypothetical protein
MPQPPLISSPFSFLSKQTSVGRPLDFHTLQQLNINQNEQLREEQQQREQREQQQQREQQREELKDQQQTDQRYQRAQVQQKQLQEQQFQQKLQQQQKLREQYQQQQEQAQRRGQSLNWPLQSGMVSSQSMPVMQQSNSYLQPYPNPNYYQPTQTQYQNQFMQIQNQILQNAMYSGSQTQNQFFQNDNFENQRTLEYTLPPPLIPQNSYKRATLTPPNVIPAKLVPPTLPANVKTKHSSVVIPQFSGSSLSGNGLRSTEERKGTTNSSPVLYEPKPRRESAEPKKSNSMSINSLLNKKL